ncbi:MAG: hypothetical protein COV76_05850 [Candidatus Omnitrophica bacterium CG11_big_fil_rev_8_21_14_0_20_64_10]|nr:MAG: hypothetical protein COV76_05850 [Candidatus Omnitrophica bacterium CG11_big_fil_rev_8_21_14_0_20_64_10]
MRRRWRLAFEIGLLLLLSLGFFPWPVTIPLNEGLRRLNHSAWQLSVGSAQWAPWRELKLRDLRIRSPQGGLIHVVRGTVQPQWGNLLWARMEFDCRAEDLRMDPGSWRIRKDLAKELLSAGPLFDAGRARVVMDSGGWLLEDGVLQGRLLHGRLRGEWSSSSRVGLWISGRVVRLLLYGLDLIRLEAGEDFYVSEPFSLRLVGEPPHLDLEFKSDFRSFSFTRSDRRK